MVKLLQPPKKKEEIVDEKKKRQGGMNRREFMKTGAMAVGAAMTSGMVLPNLVKRAEAAPPDNHVVTGLSLFGQVCFYVEVQI